MTGRSRLMLEIWMLINLSNWSSHSILIGFICLFSFLRFFHDFVKKITPKISWYSKWTLAKQKFKWDLIFKLQGLTCQTQFFMMRWWWWLSSAMHVIFSCMFLCDNCRRGGWKSSANPAQPFHKIIVNDIRVMLSCVRGKSFWSDKYWLTTDSL